MSAFSKESGRWIRYLYLLRFAILLWLFGPLMVAANSPTAARSLVSGLVTPITPSQYLCVAFFLISASFVALILARVVVINGRDRFGDDPPAGLAWLLANQQLEWEWVVTVGSQLNNAYVFWYFFHNGATEQVEWRFIAQGLGLGLLLAFVFWYAMTAVYYLLYRPGPGDAATTAKTLIMPRLALSMSRAGQPSGFGDVLERADLPFQFDWIARVFPVQGYRWLRELLNNDGTPRMKDGKPLTKPGQLYEGHFFSMMAAVGFYTLYWVLCPLTAPVLIPFWAVFAMVLYGVAAVIVFVTVLLAKAHPGDERKLRVWKAGIGLLIVGFAAALPLIYYESDPERFPVLASLLILVISLSWTFGAFAFLLDRFRVPVLTVFIVVLVAPRALHWPNGQPLTGALEEHYLSYSSVSPHSDLPTPGEVLDARLRLAYCSSDPNCDKLPKDAQPTVIVVTSTGGGIHAAAWTTAVLAQLEQQFNSSFHQHVLLLSTVSGGSVGLYDYLRELDPRTNGGAPQWDRAAKSARCSSLEAAGWGLIYYDIPKSVIPILPALIAPSNGADDLEKSPLGKDRTWSLRRAMARNLHDPFCEEWAYTALSTEHEVRPDDPHIYQSGVSQKQKEAPDNDQKLTLGRLRVEDQRNPFPAFSMNTTTVEGGNRFLLANYFIKRNNSKDPLVSNPAHSFLDLYGYLRFSNVGGFVDLPLATAAQMSATFPYVSSSAALKPAKAPDRAHFVDGGYYDNDGTVSAIEFLRYAMDESKLLHAEAKPEADSKSKGAKSNAAKAGSDAPGSLRVLLVEIRNSADDAGDAPLVDSQDQGKPWNALGQATAPLQAFYSAGHGSITGRNRNALGLLEGDYDGRLVLEHFVIDDQVTAMANPPCVPPKSEASDPLNWYLTPCQQMEVDISALEKYNTDKYKAVKACFVDGKSAECPAANKEEHLR